MNDHNIGHIDNKSPFSHSQFNLKAHISHHKQRILDPCTLAILSPPTKIPNWGFRFIPIWKWNSETKIVLNFVLLCYELSDLFNKLTLWSEQTYHFNKIIIRCLFSGLCILQAWDWPAVTWGKYYMRHLADAQPTKVLGKAGLGIENSVNMREKLNSRNEFSEWNCAVLFSDG